MILLKDGVDEAETDWIIANKDGKMGVINYRNEVLIPLEYDSVTYSDKEKCFVLGKGIEFTTMTLPR